MLLSRTRSPDHLAALGRVKGWTRERFALPDDAVVTAAEVRCALPGCAPIETVVAFWGSDSVRHRFKVFKPLAEVRRDDLPPRWLLGALIDYDEVGCDCC
jgi:hypothetical protein